ncbi:MAG TPA: BatA and WFA domain-containing protein [Planctomycetota bacterium]|nr:BatA and WFA domain-containing protein [Planctomycetota bacterium]
MTFVHPLAWGLAALLVVPVVLYLLPMPRRRVIFPSLLLWQRMLKDRPSSQSWRWLRTLLSFLLQAAILVMLILAVGKPVFSPAEGTRDVAVIVLDVSASMKTPVSAGSEETRFDRARRLARSIVGGMPSGNRVALITAGRSPAVVSGLTDERTAVLRSLDALVCTDGPTGLADAIDLAVELARGEGGADVYLLSDGRADVSAVTLGDVKLHYYRIGEGLPNVGLVDFQARRGFDFPDEYQALARVQSTFDVERPVKLSLVVDDNVVESRPLTLPPRGTLNESFTGKVRGTGTLRAVLESGDVFAADDAAYALLGTSEKLQVVLVTDVPDRFLESALTANRAIVPFVATLQQYLDTRPQPDVLIFNGVLPPELPDGNLLIINPDTGSSLFQLSGEMPSPVVADWVRTHPVLAGVTLKDVYIPTARVLKPVVPAEVLAHAEGGPLIFAAQRTRGRVVVLAFDVGRSSITFRVAFPVLVADAFQWMTDQGTIENRELPAGDEARLRFDDVSGTIEVTCPDGRTMSIEAGADGFVVPVPQVGIYEANRAGRKMTFAANLGDTVESDLAVSAEMTFADTVVQGRDWTGGGVGEFWFAAAVIALGLLTLDWYLYHHRFVV